MFGIDPAEAGRFVTIGYPGWQRYTVEGFSVGTLVAELAGQVTSIVPRDPICLLGISLGGHLGYALALHLQANGRAIAGFCAIDAYMIDSSAPRAGWKVRALALGLRLLRERRIRDLSAFVRKRFSRALLRLAGGRLPSLLRSIVASGRWSSIIPVEGIFQEELNMRLLLREAAPWIGLLDAQPVALNAPAVLIRTSESATDDSAWIRRCPRIEIIEILGTHQTIFEPENTGALREVITSATRRWNIPAADKGVNRQ
jgi:thioesterase domain-containing protein